MRRRRGSEVGFRIGKFDIGMDVASRSLRRADVRLRGKFGGFKRRLNGSSVQYRDAVSAPKIPRSQRRAEHSRTHVRYKIRHQV